MEEEEKKISSTLARLNNPKKPKKSISTSQHIVYTKRKRTKIRYSGKSMPLSPTLITIEEAPSLEREVLQDGKEHKLNAPYIGSNTS